MQIISTGNSVKLLTTVIHTFNNPSTIVAVDRLKSALTDQ